LPISTRRIRCRVVHATLASLSAEIRCCPPENLQRVEVAPVDESCTLIDVVADLMADSIVAESLFESTERDAKSRLPRDATSTGYRDTVDLARLTAAPDVQVRGLRIGSAYFDAGCERHQSVDFTILRSAGFEVATEMDHWQVMP
jgi:hypothetical protein